MEIRTGEYVLAGPFHRDELVSQPIIRSFLNASIRASFSPIRLTATQIHCFPLLVVLHQRSEVRGDFIYHFGIREVRIHQVAEAQHL